MKRLLTAFARNTVFANIMLVLIFFAGITAATSMIKEIFPEFSLDMITVTVPYPGADPEEVEEGICRKIEEALEGVEGIKQITTKAREGAGTAVIEVRETFDLRVVLDRVRSKIDSISTFPLDAEEPIITDLTVRNPVVLVYLAGRMGEARLKEWSERVKDELQMLPQVSQVETFGIRDYEIAVEVSEEALRRYGLTFSQVVQTVRRSNLNLAGGTIRTKGEEIRLRTVGRKYTGEELASIVLLTTPDGDMVPLGRVARIVDGFTEDPIRATINGDPAAMLVVFKTSEEDALKISQAVHDYVQRAQRKLPETLKIKILYDTTDMLRARINLLVKNGLYGLVIVLLTLWLFLDARLAFWAGMGIPVSIAGALAIVWGLGGTINMISLFAFIMVLGIVVDDAIVVGEAIFVHRKRGESPLGAAVEGVSEVGLPVIAAVTTTVVAFLPLAYVGGIMGKFIAILPQVVTACLIISLTECLLLLPAHLSHLPDPNQATAGRKGFLGRVHRIQRSVSAGMEWFVARIYAPFLSTVLRWRYIGLCAAVAVLLMSIGLIRGGIVKFVVFPEIDGFIVTATVQFPEGTPVEVTQEAITRLEASLLRLNQRMKTLSGEPLLVDRLALVGETIGDVPSYGPHYGAVQAILLPPERRGIHSKDIMVEWEKETGPIPGIKSLTFQGMEAGPPGAPIEIWLQGHRMDQILAASQELMERLRKFDGVYQIRSDYSAGKRELRLHLKPEARPLGITLDDLARQIYAGYYGEEALRIQRGRDDIRIKVRYTEGERRDLSRLQEVRIRTPQGSQIPLRSVADFEVAPGFSEITRTDGMRRVAVSAAVDTDRANANEIFQQLSATFFPQLRRTYPDVHVALQGEKKKMRESLDSLKIGFPMALLGIFIIIATIFRSYIQPVVIMITVPFGLIGAVAGHLVLGYDLSIMSLFGMVALTGVVVNDAIVLIERINENLAEGMRFFEAIIEGGKRRFRAIILTTISTVGGLMPMILETDFQAKFLIPMALALAAGVLFATVLTLVLVPGLYTILNDVRLLWFRMRRGRWPESRESVEPARHRKQDETRVESAQEKAAWAA
ncbi:Multidrug efflux pump subunit AcrB [Desulfacinum hydrothermale DSM 13146]|uniref:Multidrug efflux pump subunit AcrB n=1 Tax=Desulfacinum hydrothermale DSM 13146 TaxID=1121390 RepID=A0A1W1XM66_9BACT|nr:efflux RND transporter permease subunit [Desulfacinum hydrothermale]SMC25016.1 Multidrug efflux pump subunit AcrB [Desulfacinum hydrothermale DSM 13146]